MFFHQLTYKPGKKLPLANPHLTLTCAVKRAGTQGTGIVPAPPNATLRLNIAVCLTCGYPQRIQS